MQGIWKYKHAILVGVIVLVMMVYGIPRLQASVPTLSSAVAVYKLNPAGSALVAGASAGIFAVVSTYL